MDKEKKLEKLRAEMAADKSLPLKSNLIFGEGNINCEVMLIGEAPGENEDIQGRPFVGRGGKLLDKMLEKINWNRADVYITNIVKRRPPDNRDPSPEEIAAYRPYLSRQVDIINPKVVATLGRFSMNYFEKNLKISADHGKKINIDGRFLFPLYHPAAILRNMGLIGDYEKDFKKLADLLKGLRALTKKS